jgi:hypothetical protein
MNLPLNGRIAIVDDQPSQIEPLMKVLSKRQLPFTYFSGDYNFLPVVGENKNDIRVLFLDINLIDNTERPNKELKSKLIPVLSSIISEENYPYVIIYWSRHERHKSLVEEEIFGDELKNRKPIAYLSAMKSDFFNLDGNPTDEFDEKIDTLFENVNSLIGNHPAYSYLLNWENQVHLAADNTLQEIFSSYHFFKDWTNNANYLLEKLGNAYLGKHFSDNSPEDKIRASFISFNSVFKDTLESQIYNTQIPNPKDLKYDIAQIDSKVSAINEKLNLSKDIVDICQSGNVIVFEEHDDLFGKLLNRLISLFQLKNLLKIKDKEIEEVELKKLADKEHKRIKKEIKNAWFKLAIVVTPICDFVQKDNKIYDRIVKGVMIPAQYKEYVEDKSEAVYIIPISIKHKDNDYIIILDYRYFVTLDLKSERVSGLFRVRQELLSEIQSKLARHINRQGILFLDER